MVNEPSRVDTLPIHLEMPLIPTGFAAVAGERSMGWFAQFDAFSRFITVGENPFAIIVIHVASFRFYCATSFEIPI
jgi:hypothetical protein